MKLIQIRINWKKITETEIILNTLIEYQLIEIK